VDILCRSCGKQITVHNQRRVFCNHPAPCKNNFNEDKSSLFAFLNDHALDLAARIKKYPSKGRIEVLLKKRNEGRSSSID